jgi:hypothetical protein
MGQDDFGVISFSILSVLTRDSYVCELEQPRKGKSHAEVDPRLAWTTPRQVRTKNMRQDLKIHVVQMTLPRPILHEVAVNALSSGSYVAIERDRALSVIRANAAATFAAIFAHVLRHIVGYEWLERLKVGRPSRLRYPQQLYRVRKGSRLHSALPRTTYACRHIVALNKIPVFRTVDVLDPIRSVVLEPVFYVSCLRVACEPREQQPSTEQHLFAMRERP